MNINCVLVSELDLIPLIVSFIGTLVFGVEVGIFLLHTLPFTFKLPHVLNSFPSFLVWCSCCLPSIHYDAAIS